MKKKKKNANIVKESRRKKHKFLKKNHKEELREKDMQILSKTKKPLNFVKKITKCIREFHRKS